MEFLNNPIFWLLTAVCTTAASAPAMMRSISTIKMVTIVSLWLAGCVAALLSFGFLPALATSAISTLFGVLLFAGSLIVSGIRSMPNQRFEDR